LERQRGRGKRVEITKFDIHKERPSQEYSQVSQHLEELSRAVVPDPGELTLIEGDQMKRLRQDHWRMLGNGYCTRPDGVPCE